MASTAEWIGGARLRTLPAAIAPVLAGSGVAHSLGGFHPARAVLCLVVALALQVGVNYANDYSDGVRGTDADRVGPQRLVGSGAASPIQVKLAAFGCFGLACLAGLAVVVVSAQWWLLGVGVACVLAAWYYTGGKHPYGYLGLGEVFVFIFFGLVATVGTTYVQTLAAPPATWAAATCMGALSCAVLVCNNLRDLPTDLASGKRTLETRLGDRLSRAFYVLLVLVSAGALVASAAATSWWLMIGAVMVVFLVPATRAVTSGQTGFGLVRTLKFTGLAELVAGLGIFLGSWLGA